MKVKGKSYYDDYNFNSQNLLTFNATLKMDLEWNDLKSIMSIQLIGADIFGVKN